MRHPLVGGSRSASVPRLSTAGIVDPAAARQAFTLVHASPEPDLAPFVERFWAVRWDLAPGAEFVQTIVPHPNVNLVVEPELFAVHGASDELFTAALSGSGYAVGAKFRPAGFHAFWRRPLSGLRDTVLPADQLVGADLADRTAVAVRAALRDEDLPSAFAALADLLRRSEPKSDPRAERASRAVAHVVGEGLGPQATVGDLAAAAGVSVRTLQRELATYVGVSPKWILLRHRVHLAAELIAADPRRELGDVAAHAGYYDQAHLTADFTSVVGCTPGAYARRCAQQLVAATLSPPVWPDAEEA